MNKKDIKDILHKETKYNPEFAESMKKVGLKIVFWSAFFFLLGFIIGKLM